MLFLPLFLLFSLSVPFVQSASENAAAAQHSAKDTHKTQVGWQEPGLWRPKFAMDRTFSVPIGSNPKPHNDRIYLRLKNDRTVKLFTTRNRPFLEWRKKAENKKMSSRKLFETNDEDEEEASAKSRRGRGGGSMEREDKDRGTWWWKDLSPLKQGLVKIELKDSVDDGYVYSHEVYCDWGKLDPYVAKFKRGKILRYRRNEAGLPGKAEEVGAFFMRVSPHRPMLSKEYLAFE